MNKQDKICFWRYYNKTYLTLIVSYLSYQNIFFIWQNTWCQLKLYVWQILSLSICEGDNIQRVKSSTFSISLERYTQHGREFIKLASRKHILKKTLGKIFLNHFQLNDIIVLLKHACYKCKGGWVSKNQKVFNKIS